MAVGVGFEGANVVYQAPEGSTDCVDLETFVHGGKIVSCWRLDKEELAHIAETGVVWVSVDGGALPPMYISGTALVMVGDRPAKAQPVLPTRPIKDRS